MIIHCSQCGTRYHFSEEKIKPGGTKVRCARCRNVFVVMPEGPAPAFEPIFEPREPAAETAATDRNAPAKTGAGGILFQGVPIANKTVQEEPPAAGREEQVEAEAETGLTAEGPQEKDEGLDFFDDPGKTGAAEKELTVEADESAPEVGRVPFPAEKPLSNLPGDDIFIQETALDIASPEPGKGGRSVVSRIFLLFFFLVVIICSGIGGYLFWRGEPFDIPHLMKIFQKQEPKAQKPAGKIHLKGVASFYVYNQEAGQLFVISGMAVNEFSEARSGIAVRGILYDAKGGELRQQTVFCGNPFEKDALNAMPYKTIEENMNNQFGTTFSNLNIAPGKEIPFSIVFRNLPENLAEFSVEVVGSKAGSGKK